MSSSGLPLFTLFQFLFYLNDPLSIYNGYKYYFYFQIMYQFVLWISYIQLMGFRIPNQQIIEEPEKPADEYLPQKIYEIAPQYLQKISNVFFKPISHKLISFSELMIKNSTQVTSPDIQKQIQIQNKVEQNNMSFSLCPQISGRKLVSSINSPFSKSNDQQTLQQSVIDDKFSQIEEQLCLVCFNETDNIIFLPCGHGGLCQNCSLDLTKKCQQCYLCRQPVHQLVKIQKESTQIYSIIQTYTIT